AQRCYETPQSTEAVRGDPSRRYENPKAVLHLGRQPASPGYDLREKGRTVLAKVLRDVRCRAGELLIVIRGVYQPRVFLAERNGPQAVAGQACCGDGPVGPAFESSPRHVASDA